METWGIVVAGGSGTRFGAPKQFQTVPGPTAGTHERVVDRSVRIAAQVCAGVVIVLPAGSEWTGPPVAAVVEGGETRSESVRNGLAAVPATVPLVAVHDAARPLASVHVWRSVIGAVTADERIAGAVPAVPVADTIKRVHDGAVVATVDRTDLVAVQTPQVFRADTLRAVHAAGGDATDDAGLVEAAGGRIAVVAGDPYNIKVTHREDLVFVTAMLAAEKTS